MKANRNNHVFKGHKALLGNKYVTYGELELPSRYELYSKSKSGFDWGTNNSGAQQLAFSMLYQLSNEEFAKENLSKFVQDVVSTFTTRDWIYTASDVLIWISKNSLNDTQTLKNDNTSISSANLTLVKSRANKVKKTKKNIVKDICKEIGITQKNLAEILEVPEGTVSSWAVKNEIPRLGRKAIEFYIQNKRNQEIVDSYKNFVNLLNVS